MYYTSHIKFNICYFVVFVKVLIFKPIISLSPNGFEGLEGMYQTKKCKLYILTFWSYKLKTFLTQIPTCKVFKCSKHLILLLFSKSISICWIPITHTSLSKFWLVVLTNNIYGFLSSNNICNISEHLLCLYVDLVLHSTSNPGGALMLHKPNIWCLDVDKSPWM